MLLSIMYTFSAIGIIYILFLLRKSDEMQEGFIWLPICYLVYECLISLIASIYTILHIPANLLTLGFTNFFFALVGAIWLKKKQNIQRYYFKIENLLFYLTLIVLIFFLGYERFGSNFQICFETSDPASHLKIAIDTINNQSVITTMSPMFITPFTNGIFIQILSPIFQDVDTYKSFIIKDLFNLWLCGSIFYSCIHKRIKTFCGRLLGMGVTVFYLLGYPYNNMLFGFSYLGYSVTIIAFIMFIIDIYMESKGKNNFILFLISLGCFGIAESYTPFAPFTFIAVFICIAYKIQQEHGNIFFSKQFYKTEIQIFLIPSLLTIWFVLIYPRIGNGFVIGNNYGTILSFEGYIYRNLYSDFLIYLPFALYAVYYQVKKEKIKIVNAVMFMSLFLYSIIAFIGMYYMVISTYYYYKLNFIMWMLLLILFVQGISLIYANCKEFIYIYGISWGIIFLLWFTNADVKLYEKNVTFNPFPNAHTCFEIFKYNNSIRERKTTISNELVDICQEVVYNYKKEQQIVMYLGNWLDNYWFEALTNQRQDVYCSNDPLQFTQNYIDGKYGNYLVVAKNDESLAACYALIQDYTVVYENEYGLIIRKD